MAAVATLVVVVGAATPAGAGDAGHAGEGGSCTRFPVPHIINGSAVAIQHIETGQFLDLDQTYESRWWRRAPVVVWVVGTSTSIETAWVGSSDGCEMFHLSDAASGRYLRSSSLGTVGTSSFPSSWFRWNLVYLGDNAYGFQDRYGNWLQVTGEPGSYDVTTTDDGDASSTRWQLALSG